MYVVRIDVDDLSDFKVFTKLPDARARFDAASLQAWRGEFSSTALYEVNLDNARAAKNAVERGDLSLIRLLEFAPRKVNINLEDLGL